LSELSQTAQLILGAFAMADAHTLSAAEIESMSSGSVDERDAADALEELVTAGFAEPTDGAECRLTKAGLALTLKMQEALARRSST